MSQLINHLIAKFEWNKYFVIHGFVLAGIIFCGLNSTAQELTQNPTPNPPIKSNRTQQNRSAEEGTYFKKTLLMDYHSWFENLNYTPSGSVQMELKTVNYGFGVAYDISRYLTDWGWGLQGGLGQGFAVGKAGSSSYLQKRVSWTYLRAAGRVFTRLNKRFDLGLSLMMMSRNISWPQAGGVVEAGPNPFFSLSVEMRWRLTREWEIVQALGNSTKNAGASLRVGAGYTF